MTYLCPEGHPSDDADYCSECGKKIGGAPGLLASAPAAAAASPTPPPGTRESCPDCGTPRASDAATFCEVCRYNFATGTSWSAAAPPPPAPPSPAPATPAPAAGPAV